jgi:prepilin-type N-terminal cleavage/methylation domain-containing protein/prepilin-type processing-associated H-X9-DG protein
MESSRSRSGLTLIECVVAITIVGILAALLLPALAAIRQSAARIACVHNLRQLGLALQAYRSDNGGFWPSPCRGRSFLAPLLPHLELSPLYNSINSSIVYFGASSTPQNRTAHDTRIAVFLCPADPMAGLSGTTSYAGNSGDGSAWLDGNGLFSPFGEGHTHDNSVTDGHSQTAAVAEWLLGPKRFILREPGRTVLNLPTRVERSEDYAGFVQACDASDLQHAEIAMPKGRDWLRGWQGATQYNHVNGPGRPSCLPDGEPYAGIWTAVSTHSGGDGINLVFADGHTSFVRHSISLAVWRAMGTRNNAEVVTTEN